MTVTIGGYPADVLFAGPVSEYPGVFQLNARLPSGYLNVGNLGVVVSVGTAATQPGVLVSIN